MAVRMEIRGIDQLRGTVGWLLDRTEKESWPEYLKAFANQHVIIATPYRNDKVPAQVPLNYESHPNLKGLWPRYEVAEALLKLWNNLGTENNVRKHLSEIYSWDVELAPDIVTRGII